MLSQDLLGDRVALEEGGGVAEKRGAFVEVGLESRVHRDGGVAVGRGGFRPGLERVRDVVEGFADVTCRRSVAEVGVGLVHSLGGLLHGAVAVIVGGGPLRSCAVGRVEATEFVREETGFHAVAHEIAGGFLWIQPGPAFRDMGLDLFVGDRFAGFVFGTLFTDLKLDRLAVDVEVEAFAVTGGRGVDGFAGGLLVAEDEGPVDGAALSAGHGESVAMVEADLAVVVAHFVVPEGYLASAVGGCPDPCPGGAVGAFVFPQLLDVQDGAVEELVFPVEGADKNRADPDAVADRELERAGLCVGIAAAACLYDDPWRVGAGECQLPHEVRDHGDLGVGASKNDRRFVRVLCAEYVPVLDELGE